MKTRWGHWLLLCGLAGITVTANPADKSRDILYQVSTINALQAGYFKGFVTCGELMKHGDVGLGTFNALEGEMIVLDRTVYQARVDGTVQAVAPTTRTPFANVTFFDPDKTFALRDSTLDQLQKELDRHIIHRNLFYAIRIEGIFSAVKVRSVPRQSQPYPKLVEAVKKQVIFNLQDIQGTIIGFWCPEFVPTLNVPGFHFHFLSADRQRGGHVLDCRLIEGQVCLDLTPVFTLQLPEKGFGRLELSGSHTRELKAVEQ